MRTRPRSRFERDRDARNGSMRSCRSGPPGATVPSMQGHTKIILVVPASIGLCGVLLSGHRWSGTVLPRGPCAVYGPAGASVGMDSVRGVFTWEVCGEPSLAEGLVLFMHGLRRHVPVLPLGP